MVVNDSAALIRQLKIDLITDRDNPIITWFNRTIVRNFKTTQCNILHPDGREIIYHTEKDVIMYHDTINNSYRINFQLWNNLRSSYDINYPNFHKITHLLLEHHLDHPIPPMTRIHPRLRIKIEELLFNEE